MKYLVFLFVLFFVLGCSQKESLIANKDPLYGQYLQYTKVMKIVNDDNVKVISNITYLNSADPLKYKNDTQNFLISTYFPDEVKNSIGEYTLDGKKAISIKEIKKTDDLYKKIALKNKWANYFVYSFKNNNLKETNMLIEYSHPLFGKTSKNFKKEI